MKAMPVGYLSLEYRTSLLPGKKFAKVEFVAVIAHLFRRHRVKIGCGTRGEGDGEEKGYLRSSRTRLWRLRSRMNILEK